MRRFLILLLMVFVPIVGAQSSTQSQPGDPPIAALISVSLPDENGIVAITGGAGSVFPNAQVAIRNLYTEQTVYTNAGITGAFTQQIYGPGTTPFWVSAATAFPQEIRTRPGALPGGPGTIIYGAAPEVGLPAARVTQLVMDGSLNDWEEYPQAGNNNVFNLLNETSFYVALSENEITDEVAQVRLIFEVDDAEYTTTINRDQLRFAAVRQTAPRDRNRGEFAINAAFGDDGFEARIPRAIIDSAFTTTALARVSVRDAAGTELALLEYDKAFVTVNQQDGALYSNGRLEESANNFYVAGPVAQGASIWTASGRINTLEIEPGEDLIIELDVSMLTAQLPLTVSDLVFGGEIGLQPVSVPALNANNGWSNVLTPSGLAIENLHGDIYLTSAQVEWDAVTRRSDSFLFGLRFESVIPEDLPDGIYVPYFRGYWREAASTERTLWTENSIFGTGTGISQIPLTRLPVTVKAGEGDQRLFWALFYDQPSEGSRGILPEEDQAEVALSNRVRFNTPTYVLPPRTYPIEPYIPNIMPNSYDTVTAPLVPFLFPGGRITGSITRPDGTEESLGNAAIVQNRLSTSEFDERTRFGAQNPLDTYRLTTMNPLFTAYNFNQYGEYVINLTGTLNDTLGNVYQGGGTYRVIIAERFDVSTGVLSGTPFEVGDHFYAGLRVLPGLPAEVEVIVRIYPLDDSEIIEQTFSGRANAYGIFAPEESLTFETPGEYVIDYAVRYTDEDGRLWAGSIRSAGLIATPEASLVARGERGLFGYHPQSQNIARPAWFNTREYPPEEADVNVAPRLNYPYHGGDIATYFDSANSGVYPTMQVQDLSGDYAGWLHATRPDYVTPYGDDLEEAVRQDAIPLFSVLGGPPDSPFRPALMPELIVSQAYGYVSAMRPSVAVRQYVQGSPELGLYFGWDGDDPLNGQMGAGTLGVRPGDYAFLFGGVVVRNAEADVNEAAIYASLAVTVAPDSSPMGARVYPPFRGEAGGPDSGPLITVRDVPYDAFFHPTGVQPGQVMQLDDLMIVAGQAAPTIRTEVHVRATAPDGTRHEFTGLSNAIGYFYQPENNFAVDQVGVWQVRILTTPVGATSSGAVEPPLPEGGILGAQENTFLVYVVDNNTEALQWNRGGDIDDQTPAGGLFNFTVNIPVGWNDVRSYHTVTTPGYILEEGELRTTSVAAYQYSPPELTRIFPNLEFDGRGTGPAASDVVNITFAITGTDGEGNPRLSTRTFTIMHDRILSFEGE